MCGIAGFYTKTEIFSQDDLRQMTDTLHHRGPDASGLYWNRHIGLGHRRLSIIDLSKEANQPMYSSNERYILIYNGEVYNFRELAEELEVTLKTRSDTEVVLEGFAQWGEDFVKRLNGMFAFAIYDSRENELWLYRDRIGIKPLFYYWDGETFAFASEIKALQESKLIADSKAINKQALHAYLNLGYIPEPHTIYDKIFKFPSGNYLKVNENGLEFKPYWSLEEQIEKDKISDETEAKTQLKELVTSSVRYRLISDVPLGTFLSGGTDSSLITAVAQQISSEPVNTFSIGFKESKFNEANYAKEIADYLGTNHHEFILSYRDAIELFDGVMDVYDEPIADSSCVPTMLVSRMAGKHVKLTLSGDGGDETYMGYGFYKWAKRLQQPYFKALKKPLSFALSKMSSRYERVSKLLEYESGQDIKSHIFSQEQYYFSEEEINQLLKPEFKADFRIEHGLNGIQRKLDAPEEQALFDLNFYLKDDLLVKVDRASMHYSLETRVPLLDHRLVAFALNVDPQLKLRGSEFKYLLKQLLYEYVPQRYFQRPKWGFGMPVGIWLKKELKPLVDDYLSDNVINKAGLVEPAQVKTLLNRFYQGKDYLYNRIWQLIILHMWYIKKFEEE